MSIDQDKLHELLGTFVADLGATIAAGSVVVGHRLGLYRSLADGPATAEQLAQRTGTDQRYVAEWLRGQAAGGYVSCDPDSEQFSLTEEQAFALADPGRAAVPARGVRPRPGRAAGRIADHRRVPHRGRHGLARAPRGRVLRL